MTSERGRVEARRGRTFNPEILKLSFAPFLISSGL